MIAIDHIADFIFNGSCLDNLSDPQTAIKSMSKMLRPQGRIIHLEHGTPINNALLCYSPEWFFNFYAVNDYADCQVFVCTFRRSILNKWTVSRWCPFYMAKDRERPSANPYVGDFVNVVVAEKALDSTDEKTAIQAHYREAHDDPTKDIFLRKYHAFAGSRRAYEFRRLRPKVSPKKVILLILDRFGFKVSRGSTFRYRITRKPAVRTGIQRIGILQN